MGNRALHLAFCPNCLSSRGYKGKSRINDLCHPCSFVKSSKTKLDKSIDKAMSEGLSADIKIICAKNGQQRIKYKATCPTCNKEKGYRFKDGQNTLCHKCSSVKSGLKNKGLVPPNKGMFNTLESKIKISCTKQGIPIEEFKGFITPNEQYLRTQLIVRDLRNQCYKRDNYTCNCCNTKGVKLNAHHLNSWKHFPQERYDLLNLITLCEICHIAYHKIYGKGISNNKSPNTKEQYLEFKRKHGVTNE